MAAMKASLRALTTVVPMDPMKVAKRGSLKAWRKAELKDEKTVDYLVVKMDVKMVGWTEMMLADKMVVSMATTLVDKMVDKMVALMVMTSVGLKAIHLVLAFRCSLRTFHL